MKDHAAQLATLVAALPVVALFVLTAPVRAQLYDTEWVESVYLSTTHGQDTHDWLHSARPEPLSGSLTGADYSLRGSISFPAAGPPNTTAHLEANYQSGLTFLGAAATAQIYFQFRVVQTAIPPGTVAAVPVDIQAQGIAEASGDASLTPFATSFLNLSTPAGPFVEWWALASANSSDPRSDSFNNSEQFDLGPGVVVSGHMYADARLMANILQTAGSAAATATIDPVIGVADAVIPGTPVNYRDCFEIEFSRGYDALGPTPTRSVTWGMLKKQFGN